MTEESKEPIYYDCPICCKQVYIPFRERDGKFVDRHKLDDLWGDLISRRKAEKLQMEDDWRSFLFKASGNGMGRTARDMEDFKKFAAATTNGSGEG